MYRNDIAHLQLEQRDGHPHPAQRGLALQPLVDNQQPISKCDNFLNRNSKTFDRYNEFIFEGRVMG
jgi:hypothetical protein